MVGGIESWVRFDDQFTSKFLPDNKPEGQLQGTFGGPTIRREYDLDVKSVVNGALSWVRFNDAEVRLHIPEWQLKVPPPLRLTEFGEASEDETPMPANALPSLTFAPVVQQTSPLPSPGGSSDPTPCSGLRDGVKSTDAPQRGERGPLGGPCHSLSPAGRQTGQLKASLVTRPEPQVNSTTRHNTMDEELFHMLAEATAQFQLENFMNGAGRYVHVISTQPHDIQVDYCQVILDELSPPGGQKTPTTESPKVAETFMFGSAIH
ncbi:unnamed protein product [Vitrella brassicaformis CCMP3155]|uniref:Uncharacterized protein n=1 Tax=Vitrella brassicaformis (strain CCMP3155) TaxID=1169540 RepID=A0A0G4FFE4_VITBC|nr:unnamed protein product [Vitrella brassicaformis CCMP3155]|eukprot:CEM11881.1 unnamed protein product [Vitrella brassicaformis CCMP3155]